MAHELSLAFQKTIGIVNFRAAKKPDINMRLEGVNIRKRRFANTRGWMAVMQQLSNIPAATAQDLKPVPRDLAQFPGMTAHPRLDRRVSFDRAWK